MNIQEELQKIHHQYGTTESANYQIQLLYDKYNIELINRVKELEETIENMKALVGEKIEDGYTITCINPVECCLCGKLFEKDLNYPENLICNQCSKSLKGY
jgi:hypothetical protein